MKQPKKLIKDVTFDFDKEVTKCGPHIAYTLPIQGGAASGHNTSFLFKAEEVGEEVLKAIKELGLEEVNKDFGLIENKRRFIEHAVRKQFSDDDDEWIWIVDFNDTTIYFSNCKGVYAVGYEYDVTTGEVMLDKLAEKAIHLNMFTIQSGKMKLSEEAEDQIEEGLLVIMEKAFEAGENFEDIEIFKSEVEKAMMKKEGSEELPASAYAYVPDKEKVSTWKLRIDDATHVRSAVAALGKGMMGNKVQIPEEYLPAVKRKVRAAYKKFYPENDMPEVLKSLDKTDSDPVLESNVNVEHPDTGINKNKEDTMTEEVKTTELDVEALNKSLDDMKELLKAEQKAREVAEAKALEIEKAAEVERIEKAKADLSEVVKGWESVENTEEVVEALFKAEASDVLIKAMEAMNARVEEIKKAVGEAEHGLDGQVEVTSDISKAKDAVAEILKNRRNKQSK